MRQTLALPVPEEIKVKNCAFLRFMAFLPLDVSIYALGKKNGAFRSGLFTLRAVLIKELVFLKAEQHR